MLKHNMLYVEIQYNLNHQQSVTLQLADGCSNRRAIPPPKKQSRAHSLPTFEFECKLLNLQLSPPVLVCLMCPLIFQIAIFFLDDCSDAAVSCDGHIFHPFPACQQQL